MASISPSKPPSFTLKYDATDYSTELDTPTALFRITQIPYVRCVRSGRYIIISVETEEEYETHLSATTTQKLNEAGLKLVESPEMLASRTLLARKIDDYVLSKHPDDIATEIASHNNVQVEDVKIIQRSHMLKVRLFTLQECHHLLDRGLKFFSRVVPKYNMARETYTDIIQCYKCLQFTHRTARCTATTDTCSKCGQEGHNYKNCASDTITCYNCGGDHPAVAFKCPKKREAIEAQSRKPPAPDTATYASAAAPTAAMPAPTPTLSLADNKELQEQKSKAHQCLIIAAETAQGNLSKLSKYYTHLATQNGLPKIDIPADFIEEAQEAYQQAYATKETTAPHKHKHCRSRSRSHHKKTKEGTSAKATAPNTDLREPLPRPPHSSKHPTSRHQTTSRPNTEAEASSDEEPPAMSAPANKHTQQRVLRHSNKETRNQRSQND